MKNLYVFLLALFFLPGCVVDDNENGLFPAGTVTGLQPVYTQDWKAISVSGFRPIVELGKIYYKDETIYVNERNLGIHIINNGDPFMPAPIHFLEIPGNLDIAIKGNILYADNGPDLVAIDISQLPEFTITERVSNIYPNREFKNFPENYNGYFECVDEAKGQVIGWEEATLDNPNCFR